MSSTTSTKSSKSANGAPSQLSQHSRKGKKAWRKNIDTSEVEQGLEEKREEERKGPGAGLYVLDSEGDKDVADKLRRQQRPKKPLRSLAILSERSAVPAIVSRVTTAPSSSSATTQLKDKLTHKEKERLLRIARKKVVGPDGDGAGSAVISKVIEAESLTDVWSSSASGSAQDASSSSAKSANVATGPSEWTVLPATAARQAPSKPPSTVEQHRLRAARLSHQLALPVPSSGQSYNPSLEPYQNLMEEALRQEAERLKQEKEEAERAAKARALVEARRLAEVNDRGQEGVAPGMKVGDGDVDEEGDDLEEEEEVESMSKAKKLRRKTQAERNRKKKAQEIAARLKSEQAKKKLLKSISTLPSLTKSVESSLASRQQAVAARRAARLEREMKALEAGAKIGKHRVKGQDVEVQLGEDLTENLRGLKPEGNLFRDRFLSLQRRALVEPRVKQLPRKRTTQWKEYEKHPWKKFE